jgi:hypothetical protein
MRGDVRYAEQGLKLNSDHYSCTGGFDAQECNFFVLINVTLNICNFAPFDFGHRQIDLNNQFIV